MGTINRVWFTEHDPGLFVMSVESQHVVPEYLQVHVESMYPGDGINRPQRHVVALKLLHEGDLEKMRDAIDVFLVELRRVDE